MKFSSVVHVPRSFQPCLVKTCSQDRLDGCNHHASSLQSPAFVSMHKKSHSLFVVNILMLKKTKIRMQGFVLYPKLFPNSSHQMFLFIAQPRHHVHQAMRNDEQKPSPGANPWHFLTLNIKFTNGYIQLCAVLVHDSVHVPFTVLVKNLAQSWIPDFLATSSPISDVTALAVLIWEEHEASARDNTNLHMGWMGIGLWIVII